MSGALGRASVDLDAELSSLQKGLQQAEQMTLAWVKSVAQHPAKLDVDTGAATRELERIMTLAANVDRSAPTIDVEAEVRAAISELSDVQRIMGQVDGASVVAKAHADVDGALKDLYTLRDQLSQLDDRPTHIQVRADTDAAIAELRALQAEMGRVQQAGETMSVETSSRFSLMGGGLASIGKTALGVAGGIGIATTAMSLLGRATDFVVDGMFGTNSALENVEARLNAFTKSGTESRKILEQIRTEAAKTPFAFDEMAEAVASLLPLTRQYNVAIMDIVRDAEILAASNPAEGLTGAAFALREALSGDFTSIIERFNLPRVYINQLKAEGVPNLEIVRRTMQSLGYDMSLVTNLAETASGKWSTLMDNLRTAASRIGEPFFDKWKDALVELIDYTESAAFGDTIEEWTEKADDLAVRFAAFVQIEGPRILELAQNLASELGTIVERLDDLYKVGKFISELAPPQSDAARQERGEAPWLSASLPERLGQEISELLRLQGVAQDFDQWAGIGPSQDVIDSLEYFQHGLARSTDMVHGYLDSLTAGIVYIPKFRDAIRDAAQAASADLGVKVTAEDVMAGFITTQDGVSHSLERFVVAAALSQQGVDEYGASIAGLDELLGGTYVHLEDTGASAKAFADSVAALLTVSFDGGIGQLPDLLGAVDAGLISSQDASQALASAMGGDFETILRSATALRGQLVDQQLSAALRGDAEAAALLAGRIATLDAFVADLAGTVVMLPPAFDEMTDGQYNAANAASTLASATEDATAASTDWLDVQALVDANVTSAAESIGHWERNLSETERALGILNAQIERGEPLTADQQEQYDLLTWGAERLQGGINELEGGYVDAATEQIKFMQTQDNLNAALANGEISQEQYNEAIGIARSEMNSALGPTGELANSQQILADTVGGVIDKLRDLLIELGIIDDASAEPEVTLETTLFDRGAELVEGDVLQLNSRKATPSADLDTADFDSKKSDVISGMNEMDGRVANLSAELNIAPAMEALAVLRNNMPSSPAKEGPFRVLPTWDIFGGLIENADRDALRAAQIVMSYLPSSPAEQGPLSRPPGWGFLFEGLDANAKDYVERAANAFIGFFGTIEDLYSGETLKRAEAALQRLLTIREIAVEQDVGADVVAGIDAQIAAQQARVTAIGASMGTTIVQGLISATEAADIAQQIVDGLRSDIGTFSLDGIVSGDALSGLEDSVRSMELMRDALFEAGVPAEALVDLNADIEEGYRRIALAGELLGTETVQHLIALAEAEREAALAAERTATAVELIAGSDGRGLGALVSAVADLDAQIALATFAGDWGLVESLTAERDEALALLQSSGDLFFNAMISGFISDEQLYAMFESGGDAFVAFYEGFFGEGTWAGFQERYERQMAYVIDVDALAALLGESQHVHEEHIDDLVVAYQAGAISYEDALRFMADATGAFTSDSGRALLDYYNETKDLLLDATLSGENLEEAQERYDAFMAFLAEYAEEHGLAIDEILSDWERLYGGVTATVQALGTTMLGGGSGASGGSFSGSGGVLMTQGSAGTQVAVYVSTDLDGEPIATNTTTRIVNALPLPLTRGG